MDDLSLTPDHYRHHGFRVTGLPATATPKQIRRRRRELELEVAPVGGPSAPAMDPPATKSEIQSALTRLDDPRLRIVDELTWVWSGHDGSPPEGIDLATCEAHDRAVRHHIRALDLEGRSGTRSESERRERDMSWMTAMRGWAEVAADPSVWNHLRQRVGEIGDERLPASAVTTLRNHFVKDLARQGAAVAVTQARRGAKDLQRHRSHLVALTGGDTATVDEVLRAAVAPVVKEIDDACAAGREGTRSIDGASRLVDAVRSPTEVLAQLLSADDPTRRRVGDTVASEMRQGVVTSINKAQEPGRLETPAEFAALKSMAERGQLLLADARSRASDPVLCRSIDTDTDTLADIARTLAPIVARSVPASPAPSTPAPSRPAPSRPAPSRPAPSRPTPSRPTTTRPVARQPAAARAGGVLGSFFVVGLVLSFIELGATSQPRAQDGPGVTVLALFFLLSLIFLGAARRARATGRWLLLLLVFLGVDIAMLMGAFR